MSTDIVIPLVAGGQISLSMFEAAAWSAMNPPPVGSGEEALARHHAAKSFIETLATLADTPSVCAQLLLSTTQARARFCALQALEHFVNGASYPSVDDVQRSGLRVALLEWAQSRGDGLYEEPSYVRTKLGVVIGLLVKQDFPERWPTAFVDILTALSGSPATLDLLLRVSAAIQQEVVDGHSNRSGQEQAQNALVKDAMRESGAVAALLDTWYYIAETYVYTRPALVALALAVLSEYVSWIDVGLVLTDRYKAMLSSLLNHPRPILRASAARVLHRLLYKGMDDLSRLSLVNVLGLDGVLLSVMDTPGLFAAEEEEEDGGGEASRVPGESDAAAAVEILTDGHQDFGLAFAELVCQTGKALLVGGELLAPTTQSEACVWVVTAIRNVVSVVVRLVGEQDPALGCRLMGFIGDVVAAFTKEIKAVGSGSGSGSYGMPASPALTGVSGVGLSVPPLDGKGRHGGGSGSSSGRGGRSRSGSGSGATNMHESGLGIGSAASQLMGGRSPSQPTLDARGGSAAALLATSSIVAAASTGNGPEAGVGASEGGARVAGKPAGLSMGEFIPPFLDLLPIRYTYPKDFAFPSTASGDEDVEDDEYDENYAFRELREQLRRMYINILKAVPDAAFAHLCATVFTPDRLGGLELAEWNVVEAVCGLLYSYAEGVPTCTGELKKGSSGLFAVLLIVFSRGIPQRHSHVAVLLQYYELVARFVPYMVTVKPDILPGLFEDMVGSPTTPTGLRHVKPQIRSRVSFLLLKVVKTIMKDNPTCTLEEFTDPLLAGIGEFLEVPFGTPRESGVSSSASKRTSAFAVDADTRGSSGLGGTDQQHLFELVGLLTGAPWMSTDRKISYTTAALQPLVKQVDDGLAYLGASEGPIDTSSWSLDMMSNVGTWLWRILNAIGHLTKGFGNVASMEPLACLLESALGCAMRALTALPQHSEVRGRSVFILHRMIECLGRRLLPRLSECMPLLLTATTPDEMVHTLTFLNQLMSRFKEEVGPFISLHLTAVLERVFAVMPPPLPLRPPTESVPRGSLRAATALFEGFTGERAVGATATHTPRGGKAASGSGAGGSGSHPLLLPDDDARARSDLQKALAAFMQTIVQNFLAVEVLLTPTNYPVLSEIFKAMIGVISTVIDLTIARTMIATLSALVRQWFPLSILPPTGGPSSLTPHTRGTSSTSSTSGGGSGSGSVPTVSPLLSFALSPAPSMIPYQIKSDVVALVIELMCKAPFMVAYAPNFNECDAQSQAAAHEGILLLLTLAVHLAAHSPRTTPDAVLAHFIEKEIPAVGIPPEMCRRLGEHLYNSLHLPTPDCFRDPEARAAILAAIVELRRSALAELRSSQQT